MARAARAMAMVMTVLGNKEGDGKGGKGHGYGDKFVGQWMAVTTKWTMVTLTRVADDK